LYGAQYCARLGSYRLIPADENTLGGRKGGFACITTPVVLLEKIRNGAGTTHWNKGRKQPERVDFDIEDRIGCFVLMITDNSGIAIAQADSGYKTYVRVGKVIYHLSSLDFPFSDLPKPQTIVHI
jgi:hypothetical protein